MKKKKSRMFLAAFIAIFSLISGCTIIEDGQVGVKKSFGNISDEPVGQGLVIQVPVARVVETWNVKLQEIQEQARVPSSEGLIVGLDTSLLFRVKPGDAPMIRKTIGRDYTTTLVVPYLRNAVRDVVSGYEVKNIYSEKGRKEIANKVLNYLRENLGHRGIQVEDVLLRDIQLPARFKESIENKLASEQRAEQKQFELIQAQKDAEIEVARAKGAAKAQEIVRSTLSDSYLHYLWVKTLSGNPNVIYVATEANMPLFKTVTGAK
ncbi:prohibitin family protein [Sulfobacillus acidophilus]|uniref:Prohibitin family protein n=1 Tax=Sulfobacillus acidophilus TaxID=53633 RepID=A0ABS3B0D4_9FIRM|nr:prohibitin family protein [Sulfobacillus acidophilus]